MREAFMNRNFRTRWILFGTLISLMILLSCSKEPVAPTRTKYSWKTMPPPTTEDFNDAWGASGNAVFAIGSSGIVFRFDGSNWTQMTSGTLSDLYGVWGSSENDVFAVGAGGTIVHYDGSWTTLPSVGSYNLRAIWGVGDTAYVVGNYGTLRRIEAGDANYATGMATRDLLGIWGESLSEIFTVGVLSTIFHYDAVGWTSMPSGETWVLAPADVRGIRKGTTGDPMLLAFLAIKDVTEDRTVMEFPLGELPETIAMATLDLPLDNLDPGGAAGVIDVYDYTYGANGVISADEFYSGSMHTSFLFNEDRGFAYPDVMSPVEDAVTGGYGHIGFRLSTTTSDRYWVGPNAGGGMPNPTLTVTSVANPPQLNAVWGSSASNVYAVGVDGTILHYNGSSWSAMSSGTAEDLNDVWGSGPGNIFAVGNSGIIVRYNGQAWSNMSSGTTEDLNAIWGSSSSNVLAFGRNGTIIRYGPD